ncbi:MAG: hypothetical protein ACPG8W_04350 [Candidatus Promineifilaceae bacterium]
MNEIFGSVCGRFDKTSRERFFKQFGGGFPLAGSVSDWLVILSQS